MKLTFVRPLYAHAGKTRAQTRTASRRCTWTRRGRVDAELFMVPAGERPLREDIGALLRYPVPGA